MQMALDLSCDFPCICAEKDWQNLFFMVQQQSVVGVVYNVISHLPQDSRPPRRILLNWSCATEAIQGANRQINQEAARYTRQFITVSGPVVQAGRGCRYMDSRRV